MGQKLTGNLIIFLAFNVFVLSQMFVHSIRSGYNCAFWVHIDLPQKWIKNFVVRTCVVSIEIIRNNVPYVCPWFISSINYCLFMPLGRTTSNHLNCINLALSLYINVIMMTYLVCVYTIYLFAYYFTILSTFIPGSDQKRAQQIVPYLRYY